MGMIDIEIFATELEDKLSFIASPEALDVAILRAFGYTMHDDCTFWRPDPVRHGETKWIGPWNFSESIDAASLLVPPKWEWSVGVRPTRFYSPNSDPRHATASVNNGELHTTGKRQWFGCRANVASLALAACCLRAYSHLNKEQHL